jgi:gas vesicle protein
MVLANKQSEKANELPGYMPLPIKATHNMVHNLADRNKPELDKLQKDVMATKDAAQEVDTSSVKDKLETLKEGVINFFQGHKDEVAEEVKEKASEAKEEAKTVTTSNIGDKIKDALTDIKESVLDFVNQNKEEVDELKEEAQDVKKEVQNLETKDVKKNVEKVKKDVQKIAKKNDSDTLREDASDAINRTGEAKFADKVSNFFSGKKEEKAEEKKPLKKEQKKEAPEKSSEDKPPKKQKKIRHGREEEDIDEVLAEIKAIDKKRAKKQKQAQK